MVAVAQLVESRIVIPAVVGSSPIGHPNTTWYVLDRWFTKRAHTEEIVYRVPSKARIIMNKISLSALSATLILTTGGGWPSLRALHGAPGSVDYMPKGMQDPDNERFIRARTRT